MIKGAINQEEITILNIYEPNIGAPNYIKKKKTLLDSKAQIDSNIIRVEQFSTLLSPIDRSSRPKKKNQQRNLRIN
jgi:hypothetical protein